MGSYEESSLNNLPDEVLEYILSLVPPYQDLQECALVCKRWLRIVKSVIRHKKLHFLKAIGNFDIKWNNICPDSKQCISKRYSHSACSYENAMYIFGGCTSTSTTFNDLWKLDLSTRNWSRLLTLGTYPSPKACATLVRYKGFLVLFGGWTHPSPYPLHQSWRTFNELHVYDVEGNRWSNILSSTSPPPMAGHSATVHGDTMVVFGGLHGHTGGSNDIWCLNLIDHSWVKKETTDVKPHPRYGQSQIYIDESHLLILGGWDGPPGIAMGDVWLLTMTGRLWTWSELAIHNTQWAATHLWSHPACRVDNYVVVFSRNPATTPPALAYSKWMNNSLGLNQGNRGQVPVPEFRHVGGGAVIDRDVNVNGRRGILASRGLDGGPGPSAPTNRPDVPRPILACPYRQSYLMAFRQDENNTQSARAQERLNILLREEEKLRKRVMQLEVKNTPKMAMFVLDISSLVSLIQEPRVLGAPKSVSWLPVKGVASGSPHATILYTLVRGKGELIMFGGVQKDVTSLTNQPHGGVAHPSDSRDTPDVVSNTLHFITAPITVI